MEPTRANQPTLDVCRFKPSLYFSLPTRSKLNLSKGSAVAGIKHYKQQEGRYGFVINQTLTIGVVFVYRHAGAMGALHFYHIGTRVVLTEKTPIVTAMYLTLTHPVVFAISVAYNNKELEISGIGHSSALANGVLST